MVIISDTGHWKINSGGLGAGTMRIKVTLSVNNIIKATQVAKQIVGDFYFATLDHPGSRGPGFGNIAAEASEGRVQFGAISLTRASIDAQPAAFRNVDITEVMIKKSLCWMHGCLYYLTYSYEWDLGKIDNEAFIPIGCLVHMLQVTWEKQSSENSELNILFPTRPLLHLFLLWATLPTLSNGPAYLR